MSAHANSAQATASYDDMDVQSLGGAMASEHSSELENHASFPLALNPSYDWS